MLHRLGTLVATIAATAPLLLACTSPPGDGDSSEPYLRWATFRVPIREDVLLRWPRERMPLRVHLPEPPPGLFEEPDRVRDAVRRGVLDWSDVASPGLPSFEFVEDHGDAEIPIVWADAPDGDWYIAHCSWHLQLVARRFGVARVLITGRWQDGRVARTDEIYRVTLHEIGHALGVGGHSPEPADIMNARLSKATAPGLTERDRATLAALYSSPIGTRVPGGRGAR